MSDLVGLARRYVALSDELESVRGEIAKAVLNGSGGKPAHPISPARQASGGDKHPAAVKAAAEEETILKLIQDRPGMRCAELARKETGAKRNTP